MCGVPSVKVLNYCTNKPQSGRPVNWPFTAVLTLPKTSLELCICLFGLEPLGLLRLAARILRYVCVERGAALHYLDLSPRFQNNDHSVERYHRRTVCIQSHASIAISSTVFELEQLQGWLRRRCQHIKMIYAFYLFNRDGIFLYSEEWNRYFLLRNRT